MKVRALPTCRKPVGDGANRTRSMTFEYSGIGLLAVVETGLAVSPSEAPPRRGKPRLYGKSDTLPTCYEGNSSGEDRYGGIASHKKIIWKLRAHGGTCRKTPVVSICLV